MAKNRKFDDDEGMRGMDHDLGMIDDDIEMTDRSAAQQGLASDADIATKTATKAKIQQSQQTSLQNKRGNQPGR